MRKMRILALLLLVSLVALVGCGGGGGGGESQISPEKDVAGITSTLDKFAAALKSGDVSSTGLFAQTTSAQSTTILYVKDFGADLSNPADNQTWEFSVRPENITQTSLDKAIVRASKVMTTGKTLWLVFAMVREQGVWYIDGITVEETGTEGAFVVQRYYPIVPGASMKYLEQGTSPVLYYTDGFSSTDRVEKNGIIMYRTSSFDETSPMVPSIRAQRAQLFDNAGFYVGYNSSGELWAYSSLVNGGQPYRLFKTAYALGQKEVVTETTANGTFVTTMTIGSKTELMTTPLRTFSTIPVTEEVSFLIAGAPATETSIIYFADGIGVVAIKDFGYNLTTPDSTDLLFERYVNGVFDRNLPIVSPPAGSQNVVVGQAMTPVQFAAAGGTGPMTWSVANAPVGVTINSTTGSMSGTPDPSAPLMTWNTIVTATDIYGRQGTSQYNIAVVAAPALTVNSTTSSQQVVIGQSMTAVQFSATNGTGAITWSLGNGAPVGITLSKDGLLSGTVVSTTAASDYVVTVTATDDQTGGTGTFQYVLHVVPGEYFMPSYFPIVPGDEYTYAYLPNLSPVPDRTLVTILSDSLALPVGGGETITFYKESTSVFTPTVPNIRAAVRKNLRGALRAVITPEDVYYQGFDSIGNIWRYNPTINGGTPYMIFPAWMNPGETFQFTQNYSYSDSELTPPEVSYTATTQVKIGSVLVNGVVTPLGSYNNLLNITYLTTITFVSPSGPKVKEVASDLLCAKNIGLVAYYSYPDQTMSTIDYKQLILTTKLAGIINDNPVMISTPAILNYTPVVDITLVATGGDSANGYVWSFVSGNMPPNLALSSDGRLAGTPNVSGTYTFTLQATDYYYRAVSRTFTMVVP